MLRDFRLRSLRLIEFLRGGSNDFFCQYTKRAVGSRLPISVCVICLVKTELHSCSQLATFISIQGA